MHTANERLPYEFQEKKKKSEKYFSIRTKCVIIDKQLHG